ncbi:MAG: IS110 family transposase, partial [Thermoplasmata archaeon]
VAIEASTNYSYIVDALVKEGYEVLVAHPLRTRAIADAKIKSDKIKNCI